MSSRLDRLFLLLETGSTALTRKAAALQLGEVQRLHPHELHNLLAKVRQYLKSNSWETRIAASQAVEAIVANVPLWMPPGIKSEQVAREETAGDSIGRMTFDKYDINTVIKCGHNLLASEGKEFDETNDLIDSELDSKEKIAIQRQLLNQRLGLDVANKLGIHLDSNDFISNSDLTNEQKSSSDAIDLTKRGSNLDEVMAKATGSSLKRKPVRIGSNKLGDKNNDSYPDSKKLKTEPEDTSYVETGDTNTFDMSLAKEWPLEVFTDELLSDLFSPQWVVRHGAATALREIIKLQGKCGGRTKTTPSHQMDHMNQLWLEDVSLRLISVLALDRFGDFVSDQVVAPVRETCAQVLGLVLNNLNHESVNCVLTILLQLLHCPQWEARHGGMLGLKYLLAIRQDMTQQLIPNVFQPVFDGLKDNVDDVSAVAAAALVPVKDVLMETMPEMVPIVISYLWEALEDLDDLSSSTGDLLMLLSSLLTFDSKYDCPQNLVDLVPRLWPFLSHSLSSVRKSVLEALLILCSKSETEWLTVQLLSDALRLVYQRCLLENNNEILDNLYQVWVKLLSKSNEDNLMQASCQHLSGWICLMMHPSNIPIDASSCQTWLQSKSNLNYDNHPQNSGVKSRHKYDNQGHREQHYIGGTESLAESAEEREKVVIRARHQSAKLIGLLAHFVTKPALCVTPSPLECFANILLFHLNSKSAMQRMCIAWVIKEWAKASATFASDSNFEHRLPKNVSTKCLEILQDIVYFDEISSLFTRLQMESRDFVSLLKQSKWPLDETIYTPNRVYTFDQINALANSALTHCQSETKHKKSQAIEERARSLLKSTAHIFGKQSSLATSVSSSIAGALISWNDLPDKLNPVVRPLMDSLKSEDNEQLQHESALSLVSLLKICCDRDLGPNSSFMSPVPKIIKNLITYLCSDRNFTPEVTPIVCQSTSNSESSARMSKQLGIISLDKMQKLAEKSTFFRRSNSMNTQKKAKNDVSPPIEEVVAHNPNEQRDQQNEIVRRGASRCLSETVKYFGSEIPSKIPNLWQQITQITEISKYSTNSEINLVDATNIVQSLQVLETIGPYLDQELHSFLNSLLDCLCICLESPFIAIRHMAARALGMCSQVIPTHTVNIVLTRVLALLECSDSEIRRQGAIEALHCLIDRLALNVVPYIVLLIVPMLGRMSDQNDSVRLLATHCFARLVQLMPLDNDNSNSHSGLNVVDPEIKQKKEAERHFLEQLMNIKKLDDFKLPVPFKQNAELRTYQQDGLNWLAFLNKYKLHGIIADEMGLGKTLQAICILVAEHHSQANKVKNSTIGEKSLPSIVICPPTLTGHWLYEVDKFVSSEYLSPLHYTGPPNERIKLRKKIKRSDNRLTYNLVIASYDIVRNDIEFFSSLHWNYCILDEGHVIKNGKTKLSKAIKSLPANHRLILTGTPIQNNVLELWSLFDFLMPGFLGTEKQFMARYSRPILQSRDAKSSSKEQEAGVLAMESLHRQVLPFILRRMKEDVLKDLPPKIMQDYYCELSRLQSQLYEDFAKSKAKCNLQETIIAKSMSEKNNIPSTHVFQALQYLRKVCNHPKLVLTPQHPQYESTLAQLKQEKTSLSDISHAAKLCALRQLLLDCGIGTQTNASVISGSEPVVNQHRALVFCQLKSMLDIVENDLLKAHMPSVTYLRLDGNVPPIARHSVVHRFNNDPSIDVLLLTTQVLLKMSFFSDCLIC